MNKYFLAICFILSTTTLCAQIVAKRKAPKEVKPVIYNGVKYTAPTDKMGFIIAIDNKTDSILWQKRIYKVDYNNALEMDVQDDFIDSIYLQKQNLVIRTEKNKTYSVPID